MAEYSWMVYRGEHSQPPFNTVKMTVLIPSCTACSWISMRAEVHRHRKTKKERGKERKSALARVMQLRKNTKGKNKRIEKKTEKKKWDSIFQERRLCSTTATAARVTLHLSGIKERQRHTVLLLLLLLLVENSVWTSLFSSKWWWRESVQNPVQSFLPQQIHTKLLKGSLKIKVKPWCGYIQKIYFLNAQRSNEPF